MLDEAAKKSALRLFTYGLYAVTCAHEGVTNAFTANWVTQVSFDPPIVALSVENDGASLPMILGSGLFAVDVYAAEDRDLSAALGKPRAKAPDKLEGIPHTVGANGLPILDAALGYVECRVTGHLVTGDSTLVVGEVIAAGMQREGEPLTMRAAGFRHSG